MECFIQYSHLPLVFGSHNSRQIQQSGRSAMHFSMNGHKTITDCLRITIVGEKRCSGFNFLDARFTGWNYQAS
jgi:hypothetical protein